MTPEQEQFLTAYRELKSIKGTHAATGISYTSLYRWRWRDPEFDKAIAEAMEENKPKSRGKELGEAKTTIVLLTEEITELKQELAAEQRRSRIISEQLLKARKELALTRS